MHMLPLLAAALTLQGSPDLELGQKVRISFLAVAAPPVSVDPRLAGPRVRVEHVAGTLIVYEPYERLAIRRGWLAAATGERDRSFDWNEVRGIEVGQSRKPINAVAGAAGGFVGAFMIAVTARYIVGGVCTTASGGTESCPSIWGMTKDVAVYTVPLGTVVGFFATLWKPVYHQP